MPTNRRDFSRTATDAGGLSVLGPIAAPVAGAAWVPSDFLLEQEVEPWHGAGGPRPLWTPTPQVRALMRADISRALATGLTFTPLCESSRDTLAWHRTLPAERHASPSAGMTGERERALLAAWHGTRSP